MFRKIVANSKSPQQDHRFEAYQFDSLDSANKELPLKKSDQCDLTKISQLRIVSTMVWSTNWTRWKSSSYFATTFANEYKALYLPITGVPTSMSQRLRKVSFLPVLLLHFLQLTLIDLYCSPNSKVTPSRWPHVMWKEMLQVLHRTQ